MGPDLDPTRKALEGRYIFAMWHEYLLLPIYCYAHSGIHVLISQHADGEIVAQMCRHHGIPVVRGSTTRGSVQAVRQLLRAGRKTHLAMTPDGPRGPRRRVQQGLIYLASQVGLPIVPVGFGLDRPWRMPSWDRLALPRPWSRAVCVTAGSISISPGASRLEREDCRQHVEHALHLATERAEALASVRATAR
jgi:lysophospholipid acyltransferase (LPLAT)-like uncharacterized protein